MSLFPDERLATDGQTGLAKIIIVAPWMASRNFKNAPVAQLGEEEIERVT